MSATLSAVSPTIAFVAHYRHAYELDDGTTAWHGWSCGFATDEPQLDCCPHCDGLGQPVWPFSVNPYVADRAEGEEAPTVLYRGFTDNGTLVYVGIEAAARGLGRFAEHNRDHVWWADMVTNIAVEYFDTREEARAAEKVAIISERPLHNIGT
jgi:hypothetical protein